MTGDRAIDYIDINPRSVPVAGSRHLLWWTYRLAAPLALGLVAPWLAMKGMTTPRWRGVLRGRLGLGGGAVPDRGAGRPFWLHAVSVGEVLALRALVERMRADAPELPLVVSTSTPTGNRLARDAMPHGVKVRYFPLDTPGCVRRALDRERPRGAAIMETELWPAFFRACRRRTIPLAIINGRMSATSHRRYRLIRPLVADTLACVTLGLFQTEEDRRRFVDLGLAGERATVPGNLKYDLDNLRSLTGVNRAGAAVVAAWRARGAGPATHPLVAAGSTKPGEEKMLLDALMPLMREHPGLLLLIAPRHPERFEEAARLAEQSGMPWCRRSQIADGGAPPDGCRLLLLDTLGELAGVYGECTAAFVGGSLVPEGGHNILEPAYFGKPVLFGPHMDNFAEMAALFSSRGGAIRLASVADLGPAVRGLLENPAAAVETGANARAVLEENQGAAAVIAAALLRLAGGADGE